MGSLGCLSDRVGGVPGVHGGPASLGGGSLEHMGCLSAWVGSPWGAC